MTQAPEIARPADTATAPEPSPQMRAIADMYLAGHVTGMEGREDEFGAACIDAVRTITHRKGYDHQVNDGLVKAWLSGIRFARAHDLMAEHIQDQGETMRPVLERMRTIMENSGERDIALEAICGWSTCHHQLVITPTHKEPGKRWFLSPFKTALDAGTRIGQFDFDEAYVVDEFYAPRAHAFADILGVKINVPKFDPKDRIITVALVD